MVLKLLFLSAGPYLESCLEESRGWAAAAGWCRISTGCWVPLSLAMLMAVLAYSCFEVIGVGWSVGAVRFVGWSKWADPCASF